MSGPAHTIEPNADGGFVVKVDDEVAGYLSEDAEHPGLWVVESASSRFMGRCATREQGAEFLAAWFDAEDDA